MHQNYLDNLRHWRSMKMRLTYRITVIETPEYLSRCKKLMEEKERFDIINFLSENPNVGNLIEGTGGARKLRWKRDGHGKSSGFRIIYFFHNQAIPLFLLTMFAKNEKVNLTIVERRQLKNILYELVDDYEKGVKRHVGNQ